MAGHHHGDSANRADLTGEHPRGDLGQGVFAIAFAIVWIADAILGYTTFLNDLVPGAIRLPVGAILLILSALAAIKGLGTVFGEHHADPHVIDRGVFGVVRHPVYLSEILLYLGLLMFSLSLAALLVTVLAAVFLHRIARYEEALLLERFGDAYRDYIIRVPMWLPRLRFKNERAR